MSSKDLSSKSELFAKLAIKRLAQDPFSGMTPAEMNSTPVDQMTDQLFGKLPGTGDHAKQPAAKPQAPAATVPKGQVVPPTMLGAALPATALQLLAPYKGKGLLNVTLQGKDLKIVYNARAMHDTALQGRLQAALPGYSVNVLGQTEFPAANY